MSGSARVMCIPPCPPSETWPIVVTDGLTVPGVGVVKAAPNIDIALGCDGCEITVNFLAQIQPMLVSFSFPLCLLNCLARIAAPGKDPPAVLYAFTDLIGDLPAPNITTPVKSLAAAINDCAACFSVWSPGAFCRFMLGIVDLIVQLLKCIINVLQKILVINIDIGIKMTDPVVEIQETASCLSDIVGAQIDALAVSIDLVSAFIQAFTFIFNFIPVPFPIQIVTDLSAITKNTPITDIITGLQSVIGLLGEPGKDNGVRYPIYICSLTP